LESEIVWDQLGIEGRRYALGEYELVKLSSFVEPRIMHGFGFVGGYFLFSPRHTTLERAVEAYDSGNCLNRDTGCAALRKKMPPAANIEVFVRTSVLSRELLDVYSPWLDENLRPLAKTILKGADGLEDSMASIVMRGDGICITASSPTGLGAGLIAAGKLKEASIRRKVALTREVLEKTAAAINQYYRAHKSFPDRLSRLIPRFLPQEPADPFARYRGVPLRYDPGPRAVRNRKVAYEQACVLASDGPDGRADFEVKKFDAASWFEKMKAGDAAAVAEMKALLYQFRKDLHADETDLEDEGDIVRVLTPPQEGGAR